MYIIYELLYNKLIVNDMCVVVYINENLQNPKDRFFGSNRKSKMMSAMSNVDNNSEIAPGFLFTEYVFYERYRRTFENIKLGRL